MLAGPRSSRGALVRALVGASPPPPALLSPGRLLPRAAGTVVFCTFHSSAVVAQRTVLRAEFHWRPPLRACTCRPDCVSRCCRVAPAARALAALPGPGPAPPAARRARAGSPAVLWSVPVAAPWARLSVLPGGLRSPSAGTWRALAKFDRMPDVNFVRGVPAVHAPRSDFERRACGAGLPRGGQSVGRFFGALGPGRGRCPAGQPLPGSRGPPAGRSCVLAPLQLWPGNLRSLCFPFLNDDSRVPENRRCLHFV
ncbi:uncharacterized protein LOC132677628 [Panthera onca]|uniref:uncharacterized protein LOC132677628 n=1 Tax=Panthera onca TaxID=9690 RepID=UPI002954D2DA|nr:uncharacterized protein LOC132677628 [Panthera onca]